MRYLKLISLLIFITGLLVGISVKAADIPISNGTRVIDSSYTLTTNEQLIINNRLAEYEKTTTNQLFILMIPTLNGEDIEGYANRAFRSYQLGQKDKNNGILFVIAKNDRKMRIEVGYRLEGSLNDGLAGQILKEQVGPAFKQGQFATGINNGINAIIAALSKGNIVSTPIPQTVVTRQEGNPYANDYTWLLILISGIAGISAFAAGLYSFLTRKKKEDITVTGIKASTTSYTSQTTKSKATTKPLDIATKQEGNYGSTFKKNVVDYTSPTKKVKERPIISDPYESSRSSSKSSCSSYSSSSYSSSSSSSSSDSFSGGGGDSGGGGSTSDW